MSLREPEIAVETVQQNLERIMQRLQVMLPGWILLRPHFGLRFQSERAQVSQQMPEDLQLIAHRKTIEFQHDRRIERSDIAMPDVVRNPGKEDIDVTAFKRTHHWQFGNGMALPEIFAQKQRIDPCGVAADDYILIVVRKNLRLNEVTRA